MSDIIHLLPDHVANQIAAGEVIQRPASAVKELLENAIDAGATDIQLIIKDSGKTLIQVTDNGSGMNFNDARLCFERHATSKIHNANDLFSIKTKGFRGEALASIAAIAHVELKTKLATEELGTLLLIAGSEVEEHKPIATQDGTTIAVKNLFFNVPARRNFLKSDAIEMGHIEEEFYRVALIHHTVAFALYHNDKMTVKVQVSNFKQRIVNLMGAHFSDTLYPIEQNTDFIGISGFIAKPENLKKKKGEQYIFVNERYVKNYLLNYAIESAYKELIPSDYKPAYFIKLSMNPNTIDINISPTKVDIKLQDERLVIGFLNSTVKKSIGAFSLTPQFDFESERGLCLSQLPQSNTLKAPTVSVNPHYNPFNNSSEHAKEKSSHSSPPPYHKERQTTDGWEDFLKGIKQETIHIPSAINFDTAEITPCPIQNIDIQDLISNSEIDNKCLIISQRYIVFSLKGVLTLLDNVKAMERILYENYLEALQKTPIVIQQLLFPETITLSAGNAEILMELKNDFYKLGYDIEAIDRTQFAINGIPSNSEESHIQEIIESCIENYRSALFLHKESKTNAIALSLSRHKCRFLKPIQFIEEAISVIQQLFACQISGISPDGKKIVHCFSDDELKKILL